jgi:hypothetical protein
LLFIGLCVGVILLMLGFFKLKKWFWWVLINIKKALKH